MAKARGVEHELRWQRTEADERATRETTARLLQKPLDADAAVQVALLNNPGLQATYAELGISEASLLQAGRLRNPGFSFTRLHRDSEIEIERTVLFDLMGLLTMPIRTDLERRRFENQKVRVSAVVIQVASDTRRAWHRAVAARESAMHADQVREAAEASAELARRMAAAGNFSKLDYAREQAFDADATASLARSRHNALCERERLTQLLGLWGGQHRIHAA